MSSHNIAANTLYSFLLTAGLICGPPSITRLSGRREFGIWEKLANGHSLVVPFGHLSGGNLSGRNLVPQQQTHDIIVQASHSSSHSAIM